MEGAMNGHTPALETFRSHVSRRSTIFISSLIVLSLMTELPAYAASPEVPWECSNYDGDAQTRCLNTFIEVQREKIGQLESQLRTQEGTVNQLKDRVDQQTATTAELQRQLVDRQSTTIVPAPYPSPYFYPPQLGFGMYFGRPWIYGPSSYYYPYWGWGPYGHWRHHR